MRTGSILHRHNETLETVLRILRQTYTLGASGLVSSDWPCLGESVPIDSNDCPVHSSSDCKVGSPMSGRINSEAVLLRIV